MNQAVTLGALALRHGCELRGDPEAAVSHVATLEHAGPDAVSFLANPAYRPRLRDCRAGVVILRPDDLEDCPVAALLSPDPYLCYARVAAELHPPPPCAPGVHPSAVVAAGCSVPDSCEIGPGAVLGAGVQLGERVVIGAGCVLESGASVGADSRLRPGVLLGENVRVGQRCLLHHGVVLGADGFGFARERDGAWVKVPQVGTVLVGDDVEIGANTTVDRGAIGDTVIGDGVKLDNLIQVGHNCRIGAHTAIAALTGISGSTEIGARCMIGGQSGIAGHIRIADDVMLSGRAIVPSSIDRPGMYGGGGAPVDEMRRFQKNVVRFAQLDDIARRLRVLEKKLENRAEDPQ
ncbi:MAG: UDP-3-O-(3-hydroxymyristoyl)glucosamine N-acyltransferase [Chromatiales bacterium]|nr:UDP-3-O-(3-hydroxymyristoyl)glucosamine N-acyltransferase [Chromatiales bacterium]